jgi:hypothetical protein
VNVFLRLKRLITERILRRSTGRQVDDDGAGEANRQDRCRESSKVHR